MKSSIGIDIVDVAEFRKRIQRTKTLKTRLFTDYEIKYCKKKPIEHLATRFAAKEAFSKACDIKYLSWQDVEIRNYPSGKPFLKISKKIRNKIKIKSADVSLSNTKKYVVAFVIIN